MPLSTIKISDTMSWAARLSYERPLAVTNSLEPALTAANMVMQTILSPPLSWWWNNEELAFTTSPTLLTGNITNFSITSNVVTLSTSTTFPVGSLVVPSGLTTGTYLNGQALIVLSSNGTITTANFTHANVASTPDTGTLTATTTQDYSVSSPEFSHIEHASVYDTTVTPNKWFELKVEDNLALETATARPRFINPHTQDASGNITFRVMPAPNVAYPVSVHIQKAAPQITSLNQTWSPVPDYMQYVYNWGFLALMYLFADDARFSWANQKFTAGLLGRAEGLSEQERNIFLNNWNNLTGEQALKTQQGISARTV